MEETKLNVIGLKVKHKEYGIGEIVELSLEDKLMKVQFDTKTSEFAYPDAFENHIEAVDANVQEEMVNCIEKERLSAEQQRINDEIEKQEQERLDGIISKFPHGYDTNGYVFSPCLSYEDIEKMFNIKIQGFGRGINPTDDAIILISTISDSRNGNFTYHDKWENDVYIYSGEGQKGDQKMTDRNLAIKKAKEDGITIHLFVRISSQNKPSEYYYQGIFECVDYRYEIENDVNGNPRKEIKFRLKRVTKNSGLFNCLGANIVNQGNSNSII